MTTDDARLSAADGDFPLPSYAFPASPRVTFKPWHRPRKHYIRRDHWGVSIERLLARLSPEDELRYFGLPGQDLLDIRFIHDTQCVVAQRGIYFQGFDNAIGQRGKDATGEVEQDGALATLRRSQWVNAQSRVLGHDLKLLGSKASVARKNFTDKGPYDVINLDLCGGIAAGEMPLDRQLYDAVQHIFAVQLRAKRPWLLMLTTRTDEQNVDNSAMSELRNILGQDLATCEDFRDRCARQLSEVVDASSHPFSHELVVLCICQWLIALSVSAFSQIELSHYAAYRVVDPRSSETDMASLVFTITPVIEADPVAQTLPSSAAPTIDKCRLASKIPGVVSRPLDVDATLEGERSLYSALASETSRLLGLVDDSDYRHWLTTKEGGSSLS